MHIEREVEIAAGPQTLWRLLIEPDQLRRWMPEIVGDEPTSPGPPQLGSTSVVRIKEGGRVVDYGNEITAFEPHQFLEVELTGGGLGSGPMRVGYRMSARGDTTTLHYTSDWTPREFHLRLMSPLIGLVARRNIRGALARLRAVAETDAG